MQSTDADQQRKALHIGSPFHGLAGVENDLAAMKAMLNNRGFTITTCSGTQATRDGIRGAWEKLILSLAPNATAVIYYSGHGAIVSPPEATDGVGAASPRRHQFIVPMDYNDETAHDDFRGLLEIEISSLLRRTTNITENVTVIFDCCHSSNMARGVVDAPGAQCKCLPLQKRNLEGYIAKLRQNGDYRAQTAAGVNPHAVRIFAADADSVAWEYRGEDGQRRGIMTEMLLREINDWRNRSSSWKSTMVKVRENVRRKYASQRPQVQGPHNRLYFSTEERLSRAFHVTLEDGTATLHAGRVAGVNVGDTYAIWPYGDSEDGTDLIGEGRVTGVTGFEAKLAVTWTSVANTPAGGAFAYPRTPGSTREWPVQVPENLERLKTAVDRSRLLRRWRHGEQDGPFMECVLENDKLILKSNEGVQVASTDIASAHYAEVIKAAEQLARAQHLLNIRGGANSEALNHLHGLRISLSPMQDDGVYITENSSIGIQIENHGEEKVHVHVFDLTVTGKITEIFKQSFATRARATISEDCWTYDVVPITWPANVPRTQAINEHFVFVITDQEVDLSVLETGDAPVRNGKELPQSIPIRYDVVHHSFRLIPNNGAADGASG
ncbi:caspase domain-containing protein [Aspergillus aurantiobrunneus]